MNTLEDYVEALIIDQSSKYGTGQPDATSGPSTAPPVETVNPNECFCRSCGGKAEQSGTELCVQCWVYRAHFTEEDLSKTASTKEGRRFLFTLVAQVRAALRDNTAKGYEHGTDT